MAKSSYVGINNVARKITKMYVGVPTVYTKLEYIESTGSQYINLGVTGASDVEIELSCRLVQQASTYDTLLASADFTNRYQFAVYNSSTIYAYVATSGQKNLNLSSSVWGTDMILEYKNHVATITRNGIVEATVDLPNTTFDNGVNLMLFGRVGGSWGTWSSPTDRMPSAMRVYYLKMWKNGTLVRNFVPCKDPNNVAGLYDLVNDVFYPNLGIGIFTVGSATGETIQAQSVARKIVKGYVGVNGVAKQFFPSKLPETLSYYGYITSLSSSRAPATATTDDYAIVAGGSRNSNVDTYNASLTKGTTTSLSYSAETIAGSHTKDYAIFAGGYPNGSSYTNIVTAYNNSLTRSLPTALSDYLRDMGTATFKDKAIFAGGAVMYNGSTGKSNYVQSYDNSLTKANLTAMTTAANATGTCCNESYLIVAGGAPTSGVTNDVNVYDDTFTKIVSTLTLSSARCNISCGTVNNNMLFVGGESGSSTQTTVDVIDSTLTRTTTTAPVSCGFCFEADTQDYALFAGGGTLSGSWTPYSNTFSFDGTLTLENLTALSTTRMGNAGCNGGRIVGNYIILAGGYYNRSWSSTNSAEAYQIQ